MKIVVSDKMVSKVHSVFPDMEGATVRKMLELALSDLAVDIEASITAWQRGSDGLWRPSEKISQSVDLAAIADAEQNVLTALGAQFWSRK